MSSHTSQPRAGVVARGRRAGPGRARRARSAPRRATRPCWGSGAAARSATAPTPRRPRVIGVAWNPRSAKSSAAAETIRSRVAAVPAARAPRPPATPTRGLAGIRVLTRGQPARMSPSPRATSSSPTRGQGRPRVAAVSQRRHSRASVADLDGRRLAGCDVDRRPADEPHGLVGLGGLEVDLHELARVAVGGVAHGHRAPSATASAPDRAPPPR